MNADKDRFGDIPDEFDKAFLTDINRYPKTLHDTYTLLMGWRTKQQKRFVPQGISFNTVGEDGAALTTDGNKKCARCGRDNHDTPACVAKTHKNGTMLHTEGTMLHTQETFGEDTGGDEVQVRERDLPLFHYSHRVNELLFVTGNDSKKKNSTSCSSAGIPLSWILLDSELSIDVFCNGDLLTDIHESKSELRIRCNAGVKTTNQRGYLSGYGWVWYFPQGIANILSLSRVSEQFRVTFDSASGNCFQVHKDDGRILQFLESDRRLYYFDTKNRTEEFALINTVADNESKVSAYDLSQAKKARALQCRIGRPSTKDFINYVKTKQIVNCPITVEDI